MILLLFWFYYFSILWFFISIRFFERLSGDSKTRDMLLYLWDPLHLLKNLFPYRYGSPWSFIFVFSCHCYHKDWKYMFSLCVIDHLIWCVIWNCSDFSQFYTIAREFQDSADYSSVSLIIIIIKNITMFDVCFASLIQLWFLWWCFRKYENAPGPFRLSSPHQT